MTTSTRLHLSAAAGAAMGAGGAQTAALLPSAGGAMAVVFRFADTRRRIRETSHWHIFVGIQEF